MSHWSYISFARTTRYNHVPLCRNGVASLLHEPLDITLCHYEASLYSNILATDDLGTQEAQFFQIIPASTSEDWTQWGQVTYILVNEQTIIGSDNGLLPGWCQAIIWTNAAILFIQPLGTNFSEILIRIQTFSFKKIHFKMLSAKWRHFVSASMLTHW